MKNEKRKLKEVEEDKEMSLKRRIRGYEKGIIALCPRLAWRLEKSFMPLGGEVHPRVACELQSWWKGFE